MTNNNKDKIDILKLSFSNFMVLTFWFPFFILTLVFASTDTGAELSKTMHESVASSDLMLFLVVYSVILLYVLIIMISRNLYKSKEREILKRMEDKE